ncbi:MAG: SUF system NifU family Fe-S cluster assembly protein [Lachnospiraceae bacterium]|nr:SUF system NifU family Fe-S cluster assembly protein [Lachnospiraceae bacterium]
MANNTFYNEILTDHNLHPYHKERLSDANLVLEGINPSCGDDIILQLKVEDGIIVDGTFEGDGCAISQASVDIMLDMVVGRTKEEALRIAELFHKMIEGSASEEEIEELEEAGALRDISHMPARVKCAVLGWNTMKEMLEKV